MAKILIPYDGSGPAQRALDYVIRTCAGDPAAEVFLVNVQEPPVLFGDYISADLLNEIEKGQHEAGNKVLVEAAGKLSQSGLRHHGAVVVGSIPDAIVAQAEAKQCDGIVMGTRGMGSLGRLVLGSVATKVIHETKLPVTLIK